MLVKLLAGQMEGKGVSVSISYRVVVIGEGEGDYTHFVFMNCVENVIGRQVLNGERSNQ